MSPVWSSHAAVLATAMAVSGTMIFLSLLRSPSLSSAGNQDSSSTEAPSSSPPPSRPRSCLSSMKKDGRMKKKVRFAENVKDTDRKTWNGVKYVSDCGIETIDFNGARNLLVEFSC